MFTGTWAVRTPGVFKRIPARFAAFASYKRREALGMGIASLIAALLATCSVAALRGIAQADALKMCLKWQATPTAALIAALALTA